MKNIYNFGDFKKTLITENLYTKVANKEQKNSGENLTKFIDSIKKFASINQTKNVEVTDEVISFTINGRKYKVNINGTLVLNVKDADVDIKIDKKVAEELYKTIKDRPKSKKVKKINKENSK